MKRFYFLILMVLLGCLVGCHDQSSHQKKQQETIVIAKVETPTRRLYYNGVLEPLAMQSVLSPVEGRIVKLNFSYGQFVHKDQPLLAIDAVGLTQQYRKSIADYLQKKSAYMNSLEEFRGSQALYKAGVISRQEFTNSRTQYRTNQLNYYQSRYQMEKILLKANVDPRNIENLTINDAAKVSQLLQRQFKNVVIRSTANGVALFPIKNDDSSGDAAKQLELGASVKAGQLLLSVGDLSGLSTQINVNEVNIDRIRVGMPAMVTVNAFSNIVLKGYVAAVSAQAKSTDQGGGLSEFPVIVKVCNITAKQRKLIRVGMTAKVTIMVRQQSAILLPINAIFEKNGQSVVTIMNRGRHKTVPVIVGFTTPTKAAVIHGIKAGDHVVVPK